MTIGRKAGSHLLGYDWPRNVRELERCLEQAVAQAKDGIIEDDHLPANVRETSGSASHIAATPVDGTAPVVVKPGAIVVDERLKDELTAQLRDKKGNVAAVGRALGKAPSQVRRWLGYFNIDPSSFRDPE